MSTHILRRVYRIDDATVLEAMNRISKLFGDGFAGASVSLVPGLKIDTSNLNPSDHIGQHKYADASLQANLGNGLRFSLNFYRAITDFQNYRTPSATFDEFRPDFSPDASNWEQQSALVASILECVDNINLPAKGTRETEDVAVFRHIISDFSSSHRQMLASLNDTILAAERRRTEIDAEANERESEHRAQHEELLKQLEAKRASLELQSHMAERRREAKELRERIQNEISNGLHPAGTTLMRWAVFVAAIMLGIISAWFVFLNFKSIPIASQMSSMGLVFVTKGTIATVISIGSLAYAANWMKSFYHTDSAIIQNLQRFNHDMTRASWVIETILEVQHENKGEVPQVWVDGVTRGLFDGSSAKKDTDIGVQALSALLDYSASASFGANGTTFELGRKGTSRLAKDIRYSE